MTISVIVPILNEKSYIYQCLTQLVNQRYPLAKTEILIIDGMSTDGTREIARQFEVQGWRSVFISKITVKINGIIC
jgi:glycosyltransferase involved in cell wall biosynthesis